VKRDVFHHCAFEAYADLLNGLRDLLPFVIGGERALLTKRFLDLHREAHARRDLEAQPYVRPSNVGWPRPTDFVRVAVRLAATTLDDVGIASSINEVPEAHAFFETYPEAQSLDPIRNPAAIWDAPSISLAEPFSHIPCGNAGPATLQPLAVPPARRLHPALSAACKAAARRGHVIVGFVEART
jgi:hypothetical protein